MVSAWIRPQILGMTTPLGDRTLWYNSESGWVAEYRFATILSSDAAINWAVGYIEGAREFASNFKLYLVEVEPGNTVVLK